MVTTKTIVIGGIIGAVAVTAIVVGVVLGTRSSGCSPEPPSDVTAEFNDENTIITWVQPEENEDCEATYLVSYSIGEDETVRNATVNLEELTATITGGIEACTDLHVQIWAVDEDGDLSEESYENTFTAAPKEFATLEVDFNVVATGLQVVWTTPEDQEHCGISYKIAVDTDLNEPTDAVEVTGSTHTIGGDSYCVGLTVDIIPVMGDTELEPQKHIYRSPEVGNLDVKYEENTLIASWDPHSMQANCGVEYRVTYYNGENVFRTSTMTEPQLSVALPACSVDKIEVVTFIDDFESKAATEVANTYPTSVPSVTNLKIEGNVLTWTPIQKIGDCIAKYVINIQGDFDDQYNTEAGTYTVERACFQFVATVGTVIGNVMSSTSPYVQYNNDEPVDNIEIVYPTESSNQFIATWKHSKHESCSLVYDVNYIVAGKTIPQVRVDQGRTTVDLNPLYCVDGEISIVARVGDISGSRAATKAVVSTTPIEVPIVSGVELEETEDGLVLSWSEIEVGQCDVEYIIKIGEIDLPPATTPFTIPEAEYCLTFDATVRAKINTAESDPSETKTYENRDPVTDITITPDPPGNFIATWKHPKDESCDLDYEYTYTVEGKDTVTDTVQVPTVRLESPEGCTTGQIEIIAVEGEFKTEPATKPVPGDYPSTLPAVTGVELNENTLEITWNRVTANGECPVKYEVTIVSDSDPEPQKYLVEETSYTVDKDAFCFTFTASIRAVIGDGDVQGDATTLPAHTKIPPVTNVEVHYPTATPGQFSITWEHDKRATCESQYKVTYTLDTDEEYDTTSVDDTEATMDLAYCASGTVKVVPFVNEDNGDGETKPVEKKYPDQVAQITEPTTSATGISWKAVPEIGRCSIVYAVDFVTDGDSPPTPEETSEISFSIEVNDYCFTYTASVTTVVKDPSDGNTIKESNKYQFDEFKDDAKVEGLQVDYPDGTNQFIATWTPHPKHEICSLKYRAQYSATGELKNNLEDPIVDFDLAAGCATEEVAIVAFTLAGTENLPAIADVQGVVLQKVTIAPITYDGDTFTVSWTDPNDAACTPSYRVTYKIGGNEIDRQDEDPGTLSSTLDLSYCAEGTIEVVAYTSDTSTSDVATATVDVKYPAQLDAVTTINADATSITWNPITSTPSIEECNIQYAISIVRDRGTENIDETIQGTSFPITETDYCFTYTATVKAVLRNVEDTDFVSEGGTASDKHEFVPPVTNIEVTPTATPNKFTASWDPPKTGCSTTYEVTYSVGGSEFPITPSNPPTELDLDYCAAGTIAVVAVVTDELKSTSVQKPVLEYPTQLDAVTITNIDPPSITWNPIGPIDQCNIQYAISIVRDRGTEDIDDTISVTSYTIEETDYCFTYTVNVKAVIRNAEDTGFALEGTAASQTYKFVNKVTDIKVDPTGTPNKFIASWGVPKAGCDVTYEVTYSVDGTGTPETVNEPSYELDLVYCAARTIKVIAVADDELRSEAEEKSVQEYPSELVKVTGLEVKPDSISWNAIEPIGDCDIEYAITVTGDNGPIIADELIVSPITQPIDENQYCLTFEATVKAVIVVAGGNNVEGESDIVKYEGEQVNIVSVDLDEPSPGEFTVSWDHGKDGSCSLVYTAEYFVDDESKDIVARTSDTSAVLNLEACAIGKVIVTAFTDVSESPPASADVNNECPPEQL